MRPIAATSAASGDKIHRGKKKRTLSRRLRPEGQRTRVNEGGAGSVCPGPGPVLSESAVSV